MKQKNKKYDSQEFSIPDSFWEKIRHLFIAKERKGLGRRPMEPRKALTATLFIFVTGCQWKYLPRQLGAKSTVHGHFQRWVEQGIFHEIWTMALEFYDELIGIQWQWQSMDGCHIVAPLGGEDVGPSYKHRTKNGSNRSLLTDQQGIPLAIVLAPANRNDFKLTELTLESMPIPRPDPKTLTQNISLDKGYDYTEIDLLLERLQYVSHTRRKGEVKLLPELKTHDSKRWVVERTHAWMNNFRSVFIRWTKKYINYMAFLHLSCAIITFRAAGLITKI
jgi:putative transposase